MAIALGARFKRWKGSDKWFTADGKKFTIYMENVWHIATTCLRNNLLLIFDWIAQFWKELFSFYKKKRKKNTAKRKIHAKVLYWLYKTTALKQRKPNSNVFTCLARIIYLLLFPFFFSPFHSIRSTTLPFNRRKWKNEKFERNMKQRHSKSLNMWNATNGAKKFILDFKNLYAAWKCANGKKLSSLKAKANQSPIRYTNIWMWMKKKKRRGTNA